MTQQQPGPSAHASGGTYSARLAALAETRRAYRGRAKAALVGGVIGAIIVTLMGAWFVAPFPIFFGIAVGALMRRVSAAFSPLPAELFENGRPTPALILSARPVGPGLRARGLSGGRDGARRSEIIIEVRPPEGHPYQVPVTTFDAPRPEALAGRPIVVYVARDDPRRILPDWRSFDGEF
jgi:hypothetical protein